MEPLSVLSIGAGAIGTYIGGSLALQGHQLTFIERPESALIIRNKGLHISVGDDTHHIPNPLVFDHIADALNSSDYSIALFALKSFDTPAFIQSIENLKDNFPPVLCLSNGVDNEKFLESALGPGKVISGTITTAVGRNNVGDVLLERLRGVGIAGGHHLSTRLVSEFSRAGLNAQLIHNQADMKWSKMLTNLIANATSAILDMPPAEIFNHNGLYQLELQQLRETLRVMKAHGIQLIDLPGTPVRLLGFVVHRLPWWISQPIIIKAVGKGRGGKMPSFHIDLYNQRGLSEVDYLNGAVTRFGIKKGLNTYANRFLNTTLMRLTSGDISLDWYRHQPERLLADYKIEIGQ